MSLQDCCIYLLNASSAVLTAGKDVGRFRRYRKQSLMIWWSVDAINSNLLPTWCRVAHS